MTLIDQIRRIERLDHLIRNKATGTPGQLANKLGMSKSQTYHYLKVFKEKLEAPVYYSRRHQSYCYQMNVRFNFGFTSDN